MKINKLLIAAIISIGVLASCDKDDELRIVDNDASAKTLVSFSKGSASLPVDIGTSGATTSVDVFVSTISDQERTFSLEVDESSTADADNYDFPSTFTVPANSYSTTITVTGNDTSLTTDATTIVLNVVDESATDNVSTGGPLTVNIFQVCPIPPTYMVGAYEISDNDIVFGGTNFSTRIVDIQIGASATERTFVTDWSGGPDFTVELSLVCNELIWASTNRTGFTGGGEPIIIMPASDNDSTYDVSDDSFFIVEYDNLAGSFGTFEGSVFLIKQ